MELNSYLESQIPDLKRESPEIFNQFIQEGERIEFQTGESLSVNLLSGFWMVGKGTLLLYKNGEMGKKFLTSLGQGDFLLLTPLKNLLHSGGVLEIFENAEVYSFPETLFFELLKKTEKSGSNLIFNLFEKIFNPKNLIVEKFDQLVHKKEKIQKESDLKTVFLGIVSHELKTPLTSILAWPQIIKGGKGNPKLAEQAMGSIERNAIKLKEIIDDLMDFSSIENNRFRYQPGQFDLKGIITDSIETVHPLSQKKEIEFECQVDPLIPLFIFDGKRIRQVISNLLVNGIKFSPEKSKIFLRAGLKGEMVFCSIQDQGMGIDARNHKVIFEQFVQLENQDIRKNGGLGLGLPMSKKFVEDHGGKLTIESELGKGAVFTFELPLKSPFLEKRDLSL